MLRPAHAVAASLLVAALAAPPAAAFRSVPPGTVHDGITSDAARSLALPAPLISALMQASLRPDYADMTLQPAAGGKVAIKATSAYRPEHHCDRVPPTPDALAFRSAVAYAGAERDEALADLSQGDGKAAVAAIGRGLHAVQDCFSHSNLATLGADREVGEIGRAHV